MKNDYTNMWKAAPTAYAATTMIFEGVEEDAEAAVFAKEEVDGDVAEADMEGAGDACSKSRQTRQRERLRLCLQSPLPPHIAHLLHTVPSQPVNTPVIIEPSQR